MDKGIKPKINVGEHKNITPSSSYDCWIIVYHFFVSFYSENFTNLSDYVDFITSKIVQSLLTFFVIQQFPIH